MEFYLSFLFDFWTGSNYYTIMLYRAHLILEKCVNRAPQELNSTISMCKAEHCVNLALQSSSARLPLSFINLKMNLFLLSQKKKKKKRSVSFTI